MLELFDAVGLRRREAQILRVKDVAAAIDNWKRFVPPPEDPGPHPFNLTFRIVKQKDKSKERLRSVPISAVSLQFFESYLGWRQRLLRKLGRPEVHPDDPFFINLQNGKEVEANFFTLEFHLLAKAANIVGPCSPHMARARFITREFVRLIRSHELETPDDFRRALLDSHAFKEKVRQISGHAKAESLDVYICLAFDEVALLSETVRRIDAQRYLDAMSAANQRYLARIAAGDDPAEAGAELSRAVAACRAVSN